MRIIFQALRVQGNRVLVATIGFCVFLILVAGCGQPAQPSTSTPFDQFCGLTLDRFSTIDEKGLRRWIRDNFAITYPTNVLRRYFDDDIKTVNYAWGQGEAFLSNGHLIALIIRIAETDRRITFGQVVDKLGAPKTISFTRLGIGGGTRYNIQLHYLEHGLLFFGSIRVRPDATEARLTEDILVEDIICFVPGSIETLEQIRAYSPDIIPWIPWPGFGAPIPLNKP